MTAPRRRLRVTVRAWFFLGASLACLFAAYAGALPELLYVALLLAALPIGATWYVWAGRPRFDVSRSFAPHIIPAGSTAHVALVITNLSRARSRRAHWVDLAPWASDAEGDLPALQPRGSRYSSRGSWARFEYELRPPRRGVFTIGPLAIETGDAFGFATAVSEVGEQQQIIVTPETVALADSGLSATAGDGESRVVQRKSAGDEDDTMTREYRAGDAMRRVHWRASARRGELMVRQEEQRSLPEARILIDTELRGYADTESMDAETESPAFEWVVRMLASVTVHMRRSGFIVGIEETAEPQITGLGLKRQRTWGDEEFLTGLASLALVDSENPRGRGRAGGVNGPVIAIVGTPHPDTIDWLVAQRRPGELAVAFMVRDLSAVDEINRSFGVGSSAPLVAERLANSGWIVVPVRADDDHAAAWEAVVFETGRSRAGS